MRITCLMPTGTHDPSKILQSHGAKAINGLTLRSRDDVDTISDEGAEASLGDADAITIGNTIVFIGRFCRSDFASEYPASPKPIEQSLLAHEVMHVWQQQHASLTGYSLMRTISEHVQYGSEVYRYGPLALKRAFSLTGSSSEPGLCRIMYIGNCKVTCVIRSLSHYCARHSMSTGAPVCAPHGRVLIYLEWGRDKLWPRQAIA